LAAAAGFQSQVQLEGANQVGYAGVGMTGRYHEGRPSQVLLHRVLGHWSDRREWKPQVRG
jgi:ribosome modulation factor